MGINIGDINPDLLFIKRVPDLSSDLNPKDILAASINGKLVKTSYSELKSIIVSGVKGKATPSSSPTPYDPDTYPNGLYEKWDVDTEGTYINFKDSFDESIIVTSDDLKYNYVQIWVTNGVSQKALSSKLLSQKNIHTFQDFSNAVYASSPIVSIGDTVFLQFEGASADVATIKLPIRAGEQAYVYTKQGAFSPCFITNDNNVVMQIFGDPHINYLNEPIEVTAESDGYLFVNAHEFTVTERDSIRVYQGDAYTFEKIVEHDGMYTTVTKTIKKGGTVGVDCDFTDIKVAINSITDNSEKKRYVLNVLDGDYDYSNDGDAYGILLKNYITLKGQSFNTRIIKRQTSFSWGQNAVDKAPGDFDYIAMQGFTVISNNCKAPIHVDSESVKYALFENLNLINEQPIGTGDNPADGEANCFALGWRMNDHVVLRNIKANGKLWGHNATDTKSAGTFEFINCNCRVIQIGDLTSQGNDNIIVKGCEADEFQLLWFSEFTSSMPKRNSFSFAFEGNNISNAVIKDHAGTHDALEEFYNGKYPFSISGLHKEMNGIGITKGSDVSRVDNGTVKTWQTGETVFGKAVENTDTNGRLLIQLK